MTYPYEIPAFLIPSMLHVELIFFVLYFRKLYIPYLLLFNSQSPTNQLCGSHKSFIDRTDLTKTNEDSTHGLEVKCLITVEHQHEAPQLVTQSFDRLCLASACRTWRQKGLLAATVCGLFCKTYPYIDDCTIQAEHTHKHQASNIQRMYPKMLS